MVLLLFPITACYFIVPLIGSISYIFKELDFCWHTEDRTNIKCTVFIEQLSDCVHLKKSLASWIVDFLDLTALSAIRFTAPPNPSHDPLP